MIKVDCVSKVANAFVKSKSQAVKKLDLPAKVVIGTTAAGLAADKFVSKCSDFDDISCNISYV